MIRELPTGLGGIGIRDEGINNEEVEGLTEAGGKERESGIP